MYKPSMYSRHNESMEHFAALFNASPICPHILMKPKKREDFQCDGHFVNTKTGEKIGYDWEIRELYFANGNFEFQTLGQFERNLLKPDIELALQADSSETAVAVSWHNDYKTEDIRDRSLRTDYSEKQKGKTKETDKFWIIRYEEIAKLKAILYRAFALSGRDRTFDTTDDDPSVFSP